MLEKDIEQERKDLDKNKDEITQKEKELDEKEQAILLTTENLNKSIAIYLNEKKKLEEQQEEVSSLKVEFEQKTGILEIEINRYEQMTEELERTINDYRVKAKECSETTDLNKAQELKLSVMLEDADKKIKKANEDERYANMQLREAKEQINKLNKLRSENV